MEQPGGIKQLLRVCDGHADGAEHPAGDRRGEPGILQL